MANTEEVVNRFFENNGRTLELTVNDDLDQALSIDCNYCTENQFVDRFQNKQENEVTVLHFEYYA